MPKSSTLPRFGRWYVRSVVLCGSVAIAYSLADLWTSGIPSGWFILAALTLLSGSITVKIPSVPATISVSETFVFTAVLLFGPSAGTVTVALDSLIISLWLQRKKHEGFRSAFNVTAASASIWTSAQLYFLLSGAKPLSFAPATPIPQLLLPLVAFTTVYFLLNSWLIALAISFEKNMPAARVWRDNFLWLGLNFFGGASVAALLVAYTREISWTAVGIILPLLVISYLTYKTSMGRLEDTTRHLGQLNVLYLSTIETLAKAIDARDQVTHGHIRRVQSSAVELARDLGVRDESLMKAIEAAALLHDLGKLRVPEHILNKPGKLTSAEFERIKSHSSVGAEILSSIDFQYPVVPIVRHHHENWDGTGYPDGLAGTEIPIGARILAVVDCFDALTSDRPYRSGLSNEAATGILMERRGTMYDPVVVDSFLRVHARPGTAESERDLQSRVSFGDVGSVAPAVRQPALVEIVDAPRFCVTDVEGGSVALSPAADAFTSELGRTVPMSLCTIYLYQEATDDLVAIYASGANADLIVGLRIPLAQSISGWVAANLKTIMNSDPSLDLGRISRSFSPTLRSCLSTPLVVGDALVGVLSIYTSVAQAFTEAHVGTVESSSGRLAGLIEAWLEDGACPVQSEGLVQQRPSGSESPRSRQGRLSASPDGAPHSAAVLLVQFTHRMPADSDEVENHLEFACSLVKRTLRATDVLLRHGPDQLLVILPQTEITAAQAIAGRIGCSLDVAHCTSARGQKLAFQARIGLAMVPQDGLILDRLVLAARQRLESREPARNEGLSGQVH